MQSAKIIKQLKLTFHPSVLKNHFLHIVMKGNNVECPCCGSKYITFLPAGLQKRANARCMKCGSLERHRVLWLYLKEQKDVFSKPLKVLHVSPEKAFYRLFGALKNIDYCPIDLMPENYDYGTKTIQMDVTAMTFADNSFDVIICSHVMEHIREDRKALTEMYRVLKPGGWAIINTPVNMDKEDTVEDINLYDPVKQQELFGQPDHVRLYGRDYITRLSNAGFQAEVIDYPARFTHNERFRYGIKPEELIFLCRK